MYEYMFNITSMDLPTYLNANSLKYFLSSKNVGIAAGLKTTILICDCFGLKSANAYFAKSF